VRSCFTKDVQTAYDGRSFVQGVDALMDSFLAFKKKRVTTPLAARAG
jgi:hypothetical protein